MERRAFLALAPGGLAAVLGLLHRPAGATDPGGAAGSAPAPAPACGAHTHHGPGPAARWEHPEPRPGIDGSRVLTADELTGAPHAAELFDGIRRIPHVVDGIRCHCGCADLEGYRSLLSCYESPGMAQWCEICQGAGELAVRRSAEGQTLDQIRRAIDARYAPSPPG